MQKIIAGNWKMNGSAETLSSLLYALARVETPHKIIICPPYTLLGAASVSPVAFGAQDCSAHDNGAYTGEVSATMIAETGAEYVIVGHSERRLWETNAIVKTKAEQALARSLTPIICVGELREEKDSGATFAVIEKQIRESAPVLIRDSAMPSPIIVAYEPRWAIGAGLTPTKKEITEAHGHIAKILTEIGFAGTPILYGASVKGSNAMEIMSIPHVDGVLVGGASLKSEDFLPIINAL